MPLYRYDLWAAAYLIGGGCSDDSFTDFRAGLIGQGCDWYEQATTSSDSGSGRCRTDAVYDIYCCS